MTAVDERRERMSVLEAARETNQRVNGWKLLAFAMATAALLVSLLIARREAVDDRTARLCGALTTILDDAAAANPAEEAKYRNWQDLLDCDSYR